MACNSTLVASLAFVAAISCSDVRRPFQEIDPPKGAEHATSILVDEFERRLGVPLPDVTVHWTDEMMGTASGKFFGCGEIWVTWKPSAESVGRFWETALAHELGHCAREANFGTADGAHEDETWWKAGGFVPSVWSQLKDRDL